jgi:NhaP-type Na+/H+ or K+/H+ antiporter
MEALVVVALTIALTTFVTGLLLPVLARRGEDPRDPEVAFVEELASRR